MNFTNGRLNVRFEAFHTKICCLYSLSWLFLCIDYFYILYIFIFYIFLYIFISLSFCTSQLLLLFFFSAIAKISLDVRLGCLEDNCKPETQKLIDAIHTFFINVPILELKAPFWKLYPTPTFKKYISALDTIKE